mmetsp:Transcript_35545/g.63430  ORF Transcript_35545/g.63430 Transcript_35545/m.63430 type:complete len:380 (+) Transcript_35545:138-1277(+)
MWSWAGDMDIGIEMRKVQHDLRVGARGELKVSASPRLPPRLIPLTLHLLHVVGARRHVASRWLRGVFHHTEGRLGRLFTRARRLDGGNGGGAGAADAAAAGCDTRRGRLLRARSALRLCGARLFGCLRRFHLCRQLRPLIRAIDHPKRRIVHCIPPLQRPFRFLVVLGDRDGRHAKPAGRLPAHLSPVALDVDGMVGLPRLGAALFALIRQYILNNLFGLSVCGCVAIKHLRTPHHVGAHTVSPAIESCASVWVGVLLHHIPNVDAAPSPGYHIRAARVGQRLGEEPPLARLLQFARPPHLGRHGPRAGGLGGGAGARAAAGPVIHGGAPIAQHSERCAARWYARGEVELGSCRLSNLLRRARKELWGRWGARVVHFQL